MPSRRGHGLLAASAALWLAGRVLGLGELYVAAAAAAALVALSTVAVRGASGAVTLERAVSRDRLHAGQGAQVTLRLRNAGPLPTALLLVSEDGDPALGGCARFVVPPLAPGRGVDLRYEIRAGARGRRRVGPARVGVRDPFGLAERRHAHTDAREVVVYPALQRLSPSPATQPGGCADGGAHARMLGPGDEFHALRDYVSGDDVRFVHWATTAHRGTLTVRQNERAWRSRATVICDLRVRGAPDLLERTVSAAASVVAHLAARRHDIRLVLVGQATPPGPAGTAELLRRLAEVAPARVRGLAGALDGVPPSGPLLVAVLPAPGPGPADDARVIRRAGRGYNTRLALLVDGDRPGGGAGALLGALSAAGWRVGVAGREDALDAVWRGLSRRRTRPPRPTSAGRRTRA